MAKQEHHAKEEAGLKTALLRYQNYERLRLSLKISTHVGF
jgi:hypothetical protein